MATTSYGWVSLSAETMANTFTQGDQMDVALAANAAGTGYITAWLDREATADGRLAGRLFGGDGAPIGGELSLTPPPSLLLRPDVVALADGRFVVTYTEFMDGVVDVRARILAADGTPITLLDVAVGSFVEGVSEVTALKDGGFAFSWLRILDAGNQDVYISVYNADGSVRHAPARHQRQSGASSFPVDGGPRGRRIRRRLGRDARGRGRQRSPLSPLRRRRQSARRDRAGVLIDTAGSINRDIQVAGLPNGGFVVAYADDSWDNDGGVTARIYNANGLATSGFIQVNSPMNGAATLGIQDEPSLAVLPDGMFAVGWNSGDIQFVQAFNSFGLPVGDMFPGSGQCLRRRNHRAERRRIGQRLVHPACGRRGRQRGAHDDARIAALHHRRRQRRDDRGLPATIGDVIDGLGGNDTLDGGGGDPKAGGDTALFSQSLASYVLHDLGDYPGLGRRKGATKSPASSTCNSPTVPSRSRTTATRCSIPSTISAAIRMCSTPASTRSTTSTASAGTKAAIRTRFFDTSGYLAVNQDVAAGGMNPLDHYHQLGWHEGRDPSADFRHHALSDPQSRRRGCRRRSARALHAVRPGGGPHAYAAVGDIVGGFDAQYYLFHNPDVAAAGVDPLHALQHLRLARRARPERLLRHRRLSRALRRRRGGRRQSARALRSSSAGRKAAIRPPASTRSAISPPIRTSRPRTSTRSSTI